MDPRALEVLLEHLQLGAADPVAEIHTVLIFSSTGGWQWPTAYNSTSCVKLEVVESPAEKSIHINLLTV